jgi:thymidylate kinase
MPQPSTTDEAARSCPEFSVLLGPDYAGKSTLISALSTHDVQCVSYDGSFVQPECSLVNDLRDGFVTRAVRSLGTAYSKDFVITLLQTSVIYLRDQAMGADSDRPVVMDSYYYKILAKCVLTGLVNDDMFAWWRAFPQPSRVIYLDVDPGTAWQRSGEGALLNPFEYYGEVPTWDGFHRFQTDLRLLMIQEIGPVPMSLLDATDGVGQTVTAVRRTIGSGDAAQLDG